MLERDHFGKHRRWAHLAARLGSVLSVFSGMPSAASGGPTESPFAAAVMEYSPAPGRLVRDVHFNNSANALGPPDGLGTNDGNNTSVVTLGGFGGLIVLAFDHPVLDDPRNPFGMDAIVFGNAFWRSRDPERHWAECATIEISRDANGNGLPDDTWYLIPGSHIAASAQATFKTWDDDIADTTYPPADATWLPHGAWGTWTNSAFLLPAAVFGPDLVVNPRAGTGQEGIFGYADYTPTLVLGDLDADDFVDDTEAIAEEFYTIPDDPLETGISWGSGGGDAFDIRWAVDPTTGEPAELPAFDFIRLTTAVAFVSPTFGEKSGEIDAVADVRPDPFGDADEDDDIDLLDVAALQECFSLSVGVAGCERFDTAADHVVGDDDVALFMERMTGPR